MVSFYVAKNILKNPHDMEECVNDTYLAAWNTIPPQKPKGKFKRCNGK
ncbi:MAG: hypothetical protein K2N51_12415 [Lachnospiraceae bacterium]|nr:hypothetical protein [Lachnospiraceae bacterium]